MTTIPKVPSFETRGAQDADPATAALVEDIARSRETDYFLMKDQLTDHEKEVMAKARAFGEAEVLPVVNDYWERAEFPFELIPKLAALNVVGDYNLEGYGCTSMTAVANGIVNYELSPIARNQMIQSTLVEMLGDLTAMQLYSIRMGRLIDDGKVEETMAALAKYYCTVKGRNVCRLARDVLGGNGVTLDFHVSATCATWRRWSPMKEPPRSSR